MTLLIWPFPTKDPSQYRRIDQGWDLQTAPGTPILAVADGTVGTASDPNGFGPAYPVLVLANAIDGIPAVYYGHNELDKTVQPGSNVVQGQRIATTLQVPKGNASKLPGWLEIGWWKRRPTGDGQSMHDHLLPAPVFRPKESQAMKVLVPNGVGDAGGRAPVWECDSQGNINNWNGAPFLKSLAQVLTEAGQDPRNHPPIDAILPFSDGGTVGLILCGNDGHQDPSGEWIMSTYKITHVP